MPAQRRVPWFVIGLAMISTASATAQPVITGVSQTILPRSDQVTIMGSGFGTSGQVVIAGLDAWTTTWTDQRIVAFVPEQAPLGHVSLELFTGGQSSNLLSLTVNTRRVHGRTRETFETNSDDQWWQLEITPAGAIDVPPNNPNDALPYAPLSGGDLQWIERVNRYPYAPTTTGPDGAYSLASSLVASPNRGPEWRDSSQIVG